MLRFRQLLLQPGLAGDAMANSLTRDHSACRMEICFLETGSVPNAKQTAYGECHTSNINDQMVPEHVVGRLESLDQSLTESGTGRRIRLFRVQSAEQLIRCRGRGGDDCGERRGLATL